MRPGGDPDPDAALTWQPSALERRERSLARLAELGATSVPDLPPVAADEEAVLRTAEEIARRAQALWAVASRANGVIGECMIR